MYNGTRLHGQSSKIRWRLTAKKVLMAVASVVVLTALLRSSYEYGKISQGIAMSNQVLSNLGNDVDRSLRFRNFSVAKPQAHVTRGMPNVSHNLPLTSISSRSKTANTDISRANSTITSPVENNYTKPTKEDEHSVVSTNSSNSRPPENETIMTKPTTITPVLPSYTPFDYIIANPNLCYKHKPQILVWTYSAPRNFAKRRAIRETWGNASLYLPTKIVFIFSLAAVHNQTLAKKIVAEQTTYGDIVQDGSFTDTYKNLTYKAQSMLKWTTAYCTDIKLLFKVDDDSFLIPNRFSKWVRKFETNETWPTNSIIGTLWHNRKPARRGKWSSTVKEFPGKAYAKKACPGSGYLISGDLVPKLKNAMTKVQFLWLEDMYTTGLLAEYVGDVNYISNSPHHVLLLLINDQWLKEYRNNRKLFLFGHVGSEKRIYKFWDYARKFPY